MRYPQQNAAALARSFRFSPASKAIMSVLLLLFMLALSACGSSAGNTSAATPTGTSNTATSSATSSSATPSPTLSTPQPTATPNHAFPAATATPGSQATPINGYLIKVYFSKFPDSLNNYTAVFPVNRFSPTIAVATFSIQLLIAGPTPDEWNAGYFSEFNSILTGPSSCSAPHPTGGPDFTLTLNMKGPTPQQGTATLRLCRATSSPGIGADARILAEINATLKQFSTIKNVVVLTQAGHCFGDESGQDRCLK